MRKGWVLVVLLVLVAGGLAVVEGGEEDTYVVQTRTGATHYVNASIVYENQTVYLTNTTIVNTSASLTYKNCTIIFLMDYGLNYPPSIYCQGNMAIENSTLKYQDERSPPEPVGKMYFNGYILTYGQTTLVDCDLQQIDVVGYQGNILCINCSLYDTFGVTFLNNASIVDSSFRNVTLVESLNAHIEITNCSFTDSRGYGLSAMGTKGKIIGSTFSRNDGYGLWMSDCDIHTSNNHFGVGADNNSIARVFNGTKVTISFVGFVSGKDGWNCTISGDHDYFYQLLDPKSEYWGTFENDSKNSPHTVPVTIIDNDGIVLDHSTFNLKFTHPMYEPVDLVIDPEISLIYIINLTFANGPVNAVIMDLQGLEMVTDGGNWEGSTTVYSSDNIEFEVQIDGSMLERNTFDGLYERSINITIPYGIHNITAIVDPAGNLAEGNESDNEMTIQVLVDQYPTAVLFTDDLDVPTNQTIYLYSDGTSDPDGGDLNVTLDLGDGTIIENPETTESHIYTMPGMYEVVLNATDEFGLWSTQTIILNVTDITAHLDVDVVFEQLEDSPDVKTEAVFSVEDSDWGAQGYSAVLNFMLDYGDGDSVTRSASDLLDDGFEFTHLYADDGAYTAELKVTFIDRYVITVPLNVTVNNLPPEADATLPSGTLTEEPPLTYYLDATDSTDPDDTNLTYVWTINGQKFYGANVTWVVNETGNYAIELEVIDDDGDSDTLTSSLKVGEEGGNDGGGDGLGPLAAGGGAACCILVVVVLLIIIIVIVVVIVVVRRRKSPYTIDEEAVQNKGSHRIDFIIMQQDGSEHYIKYELFKQDVEEKGQEVCIIWDSPDGGKWEVAGTFAGDRDAIMHDVAEDITRLGFEGYKVDYKGSGKLLKK